LNLNISAPRQNIKNLVNHFGAFYMGKMHANFQATSFTGMGGRGGDRWKNRQGPFLAQTVKKFLTPP